MRRWRDWAWPTCPKIRCRSTSPKDVSSGSSAIGAHRFQAITSTIPAFALLVEALRYRGSSR
jgi:hypothetical protein